MFGGQQDIDSGFSAAGATGPLIPGAYCAKFLGDARL
jgi:hypothetical protein